MKSPLKEYEILRLQQRLSSREDYIVAVLLWGLFLFNIITVWIIGRIDSNYGGVTIMLQVAPAYLFFPAFATFGLISDRILVTDMLGKSSASSLRETENGRNGYHLSREDVIRICLISAIIFLSLPWITARLGLFLEPYYSTYGSRVLFFQPVHVGENHGWIGASMLIAVILISKTEKLYMQSIFKELSVYLLCFSMLWGLGLTIEDFAQEQFHASFPFLVWGSDPEFWWGLILQIVIVALLSLPIYYFGWRKYYKQKLHP